MSEESKGLLKGFPSLEYLHRPNKILVTSSIIKGLRRQNLLETEFNDMPKTRPPIIVIIFYGEVSSNVEVLPPLLAQIQGRPMSFLGVAFLNWYLRQLSDPMLGISKGAQQGVHVRSAQGSWWQACAMHVGTSSRGSALQTKMEFWYCCPRKSIVSWVAVFLSNYLVLSKHIMLSLPFRGTCQTSSFANKFPNCHWDKFDKGQNTILFQCWFVFLRCSPMPSTLRPHVDHPSPLELHIDICSFPKRPNFDDPHTHPRSQNGHLCRTRFAISKCEGDAPTYTSPHAMPLKHRQGYVCTSRYWSVAVYGLMVSKLVGWAALVLTKQAEYLGPERSFAGASK